ncbi:ribonuclease H-like domain-containing protein [Tanacetum coccineum]
MDISGCLEGEFYPTYLTTLAGRRWLLTHGIQLALLKCLKSLEYQGTMGHALGQAVDFGMQEGLEAGYEHGTAGINLFAVDAYNPEVARASYINSVKALEDVDFPFVNLLKSKKDAGIDEVLDCFLLDGPLAGLPEAAYLQSCIEQLSIPIYHAGDKIAVGETSLSFALMNVHARAEGAKKHVAALRQLMMEIVFAPLSSQTWVGEASTFVASLSVEDYDAEDTDEALGSVVAMFHVRGSSFPLRSLSLYAPFNNDSVTSYGPSHLGPSLPPSLAWLASLLCPSDGIAYLLLIQDQGPTSGIRANRGTLNKKNHKITNKHSPTILYKMSQPANDEFSQHLSDDEESNHEDASDTEGEYDIWAIEMEHYLEYIDNEVWKKFKAVKLKRKAKNILLMAIPKEHMRRFHGMDDAKEIWEAIRTRFGGNANSKKMQKAVFKQQFEAFTISSSEGSLPLAWSNLAMTMRTKPDVDTLSIDDLYNNLRVFEQEIQGASKTSSSAQNLAFVSQCKAKVALRRISLVFTGAYSTSLLNTSSTNNSWKKKFLLEFTAKGTHDGKKKRDSFYQHQEAGKQEKNQMGLLTMDDGIVNWGEHTEVEETNHALMAISSSNEVTLCSKTCIDSYNTLKLLCDEQMNQLGDQEAQILAYSQAVKKLEAQLVTFQKQQLSLNEKLTFQANEIYEKDEKLKRYRRIGMKAVKEKEQLQKTLDSWKDSSKNLWRLINSGMSSNSKVGLGFEIKSNNEVLSYEEEMNFSVFNCSKEDSVGKPLYSRFTKTNDFKGGPQKPEISGSDDNSSEHSTCQSNDSEGSCGNTSEHSFETESESLSEPNEMSKSRLEVTNEKDVSAPKSKEVEPSCVSHIKTPRQPLKDKETHKVNRKNWNDMMERELGEGYSFTKKKCFVCGSLSHLIKDCDYYEKKMAREAEVKRVVNTGNGVAKPVWTNANRINHSNKFVPRSVQLNAGRPKFNSVRPNINTGRTNINSGRPKVNAVSPKVNTVRSKQPVPHKTSNSLSPKRPQMNQINQRRDFSKSYSSVRRPFAKTTAQMSHSNAVMGIWGSAVKTSASYNWRNSRPNFNYNSGPTFIRTDHPLKNMVDRGIFDSGCSGHMTGNKDQLEDFEEFNGGSVTFGGSKGYISGKGKIRVGNLDFDSVSFVKELGHFNLFSISQICDKQHKVLFTETECLVVSSDFKMPDENQILLKNRNMLEFYGNKGIKQEYSNAKTPQQNGVAKRMNRTLIEAARTMLADSLLPTTFWAEAVSTACYIFNRVRVTKPQNKTPYELLFGHKPIISYIRPFGCHVTILDTLSVLGKFDGKSDEGFLVGYSLNSKAYMVYNLVTKRVEVNLHVNFLEDKPNVKGVGYRWMFDIDYLTDSMNYILVSLENQANPHAGASESSKPFTSLRPGIFDDAIFMMKRASITYSIALPKEIESQSTPTLTDSRIFTRKVNSPWLGILKTMTKPRPTPFSTTTPRAKVFAPFVIISDTDNEITTLPVRPAPPSPDRTPALYGYLLDSGDDSSDEDLSETAKSLHTHAPPTRPLPTSPAFARRP